MTRIEVDFPEPFWTDFCRLLETFCCSPEDAIRAACQRYKLEMEGRAQIVIKISGVDRIAKLLEAAASKKDEHRALLKSKLEDARHDQ